MLSRCQSLLVSVAAFVLTALAIVAGYVPFA